MNTWVWLTLYWLVWNTCNLYLWINMRVYFLTAFHFFFLLNLVILKKISGWWMKDCCLIKQLNKCHFQVGGIKAPFLAGTWATRRQEHCRTDSHSPWAWPLPTGCPEPCQRDPGSPLPFCTRNSNSSSVNLCLLGSVSDSWRGTAGLQPGSQLDTIRMRKRFPS